MSYQIENPKFTTPLFTFELQEKFKKYYEESKNIKFTELYCPNCSIHIGDKFVGANWYQPFRCPKCKGVFVFNLGEFRAISAEGYEKYLWQKRVGIR